MSSTAQILANRQNAELSAGPVTAEGRARISQNATKFGLFSVANFVRQVFRRSDFEIGTAAKSPGGVDDFPGEGLFERRVGREFGEVAGFELIKDVAFFGVDEIRNRKKTESGRVL